MGRRWMVGMVAMLAFGCVRVPEPEIPAPEPVPVPVPPPPVLIEPGPTGVYSITEAMKDALSGPWTYVGTGPWTGNQRVKACAYRNERVLVVDVYCTIKEVKAFRVDVFSPTRGRVSIYAEAKSPVSAVTRRDYFSFTATSEPPPGLRADLPPVTLTMSFADLLDYDGRRYRSFLPSCYGGTETYRRQKGGCLGDLAGRASEWTQTNRPFLNEPPPDWYRIITDLRALARQHGHDPQ